MNHNIAIAFLSKDRVEQSRQSIVPVLDSKVTVLWIDGSKSDEGKNFPSTVLNGLKHQHEYPGIGGGADAAIVFALTTMLTGEFTHVGLVEQDVLLESGWLGPTMALFERGQADGLEVGAVSARAYEDRVLCQRDGYALMHNLGSGMVIFSRRAAEIVLQHYRSAHTSDNRAIFAVLSGLDIGRWWAFRNSHQFLTADWGFDALLARHGLASLALTPSCARMLEDIQPMGLQYLDQPVELLRDDDAFEIFAQRTWALRHGEFPSMSYSDRFYDSCAWTIFAHQLAGIHGGYDGQWRLKWSQGFGPFTWVSAEAGAMVTMPLIGDCHILVSGSETRAAMVELRQDGSLWQTTLSPDPAGKVLGLESRGEYRYRDVTLTALSPGVQFHGIRTRSVQPITPHRFDYHTLPIVEADK